MTICCCRAYVCFNPSLGYSPLPCVDDVSLNLAERRLASAFGGPHRHAALQIETKDEEIPVPEWLCEHFRSKREDGHTIVLMSLRGLPGVDG